MALDRLGSADTLAQVHLATLRQALADPAAPAPAGAGDDLPRRLSACLAAVEGLEALPGPPGQPGERAAAAAPRRPPLPPPPPPSTPAGAAAAPGGMASRPRAEGRPPLAPEAPLTTMAGVGARTAAALMGRGLRTVEDLLRFLPRRYQGRESCAELGQLRPEQVAAVEGEVVAVQDRRARGPGRGSVEVVLGDGTGNLSLVWFRIPGRAFAEQFVRGTRVRAAGVVRGWRGRLQIVHPEFSRVEVAEAAWQANEQVVPIYLDVQGLAPRLLRALVAAALAASERLEDPLPGRLRQRRGLPSLAAAVRRLHEPGGADGAALEALQGFATAEQRRFVYEELLTLQLAILLRHRGGPHGELAPSISRPEPIERIAELVLPFAPTAAQLRCMREVDAGLAGPRPMHRLLQGDVGSGKTAVAYVAAARVALAGYQVAIMAPTELLTEQHYRSAEAQLGARGIGVARLTGSLGAARRRALQQAARAGEVQVVVGTHALLFEAHLFARLGLAVIDEQHRFGVLQRARLRQLGQAGGQMAPHLLVMTATPIPRTLAMTVYADLDVSTLDELPPGRSPVATTLYFERQRPAVYRQVREAVAAGRQAYVVFPLVEESDREGMQEVRDAVGSFETLAADALRGLRLGLVHGRLAAADKDRVMGDFAAGRLDVLVSTTVIEVGIDVANATVIVIEHAERFGLSQLHQLRGRVGRGRDPGSCLLVARGRVGDEVLRRLALLVRCADGFQIAEEDLAIRGPGDVLGTRQAGLPVLSLADLTRDREVLSEARDDARAILADDPQLAACEHRLLARRVASLTAEGGGGELMAGA